ncbi:S8 family serine peptidase [Phytomonospora sp. NPDC050363]|uniref:S8 family serine peptidase n=1 Tax=Phytomonospora sp. NPDC050363 TaxID=3155642 RepID=UPI0033F67CE8
MTTPSNRRRRVIAVAAVAVFAATAAGAAPFAAPPANAADKIDASVRADLAEDGTATFYLRIDDGADLAAATGSAATDDERARSTFDALHAHADRTQAGLRTILDEAGATYETFWIANTIKATGDERLVDALAERPEVTKVRSEKALTLAEPVAAQDAEAADGTPQWGLDMIGAPRVWDEFATRGQGVVIANIDSGVQYDHPSLVGSYRGNNGDGTFSHDYNWFDPTGTCATAPCDNNGHGTHTMGTMVGADGYGVAPGATWIAAKGCEARSCTETSLLRAGEWILAPTDVNGENPRPDLAPDIVNNSWGGGRGDTWYSEIIESWRAAGIFPAFAAGNYGNGVCGTVDSPGDNAAAYTVGAVDSTGTVAGFSGLGPSGIAEGKPDITAPGVDVVSTMPGGKYQALSGTSMATPHVAGAVALLWSAAPALAGDIEGTSAALGLAAADKEDLRCGGDAARNGVYGEGVLDVYQAVLDAPRGNAGHLTGTVTDAATGEPLAKTGITATGTQTRSTLTDAEGHYRLRLVGGAYTVGAALYGYQSATSTVDVAAGGEHVVDLTLTPAATHKVAGTVSDPQGRRVPGASVHIDGAPIDALTTTADGSFAFPKVAEGAYQITVVPAEPALCLGPLHGDLVVDGDESVALTLPYRTDAFGWHCEQARPAWIDGRQTVAIAGDEDAVTIGLPFPVTLYNGTYDQIAVTTNGLLNVEAPRLGDYANTPLGDGFKPSGVIAPFWDDLIVDDRAGVRTAVTGSAGQRLFAVEWHDVRLADQPTARVSFEVVFAETGGFTFQYRGLSGDLERGASATVGIEDTSGGIARQYSFELPVLRDGVAIRFGK